MNVLYIFMGINYFSWRVLIFTVNGGITDEIVMCAKQFFLDHNKVANYNSCGDAAGNT